MIYVYGTSHVSHESLELIKEKIDEHDPDTVALELDLMRLNALVNDSSQSSGPMFVRIIKKFQDMVGSKTGVMPGEEMLYAYHTAVEDGRDVALIDQEITDTVEKLKQVRRPEKVKAVIHLVLGAFIPGSFNVSDIPEEEFIDELLEEFRHKFPELHYVLVEDRNQHMVAALKQLKDEEPEKDIVAFVGAAHKKAIQEELDGIEFEAEKTEEDTAEIGGDNVKGLQRFE